MGGFPTLVGEQKTAALRDSLLIIEEQGRQILSPNLRGTKIIIPTSRHSPLTIFVASDNPA